MASTQARPWLPVEAVTMLVCCCCCCCWCCCCCCAMGGSLLCAPRSLKLPVLCLCSILRLRSQPSSRDSFSDLVTVFSRECLIELETKVHWKVRNHGEGPYGLLVTVVQHLVLIVLI